MGFDMRERRTRGQHQLRAEPGVLPTTELDWPGTGAFRGREAGDVIVIKTSKQERPANGCRGGAGFQG